MRSATLSVVALAAAGAALAEAEVPAKPQFTVSDVLSTSTYQSD